LLVARALWPRAVALRLEAVAFWPTAVALVLVALALWPRAVEFLLLALALWPTAVALVLVAWALLPRAVAFLSLAMALVPTAVALVLVARAFAPQANASGLVATGAAPPPVASMEHVFGPAAWAGVDNAVTAATVPTVARPTATGLTTLKPAMAALIANALVPLSSRFLHVAEAEFVTVLVVLFIAVPRLDIKSPKIPPRLTTALSTESKPPYGDRFQHNLHQQFRIQACCCPRATVRKSKAHGTAPN